MITEEACQSDATWKRQVGLKDEEAATAKERRKLLEAGKALVCYSSNKRPIHTIFGEETH